MFQLAAFCGAQNSKLNEIDSIRAELACYKDKNSQEYIKTKQRLGKLIVQNKINYSIQSRFADIQRLIEEKKYNSAIYELNDLIDNNVEVAKCYEILGDICLKTSKDVKSAAKYYKTSMDNNNEYAHLKLAKLYLIEQKNPLGIEHLRQIVETTNDASILLNIEDFIQNKVTPSNRLEANNFYEILGQIYMRLNRKQESYSAFDKALQLNPRDVYLQYYFGDMLYTDNQNTGALVVYDSILKDNPFESQIRASKAKTLIREGNLLSANKEFLTILQQYPNSNQAKYGIFKIFENRLSADKILEKIYANVPDYKITKEDYVKFVRFLKEIGDYNGAQIFNSYIKQMEHDEQKSLKAQQKEEKQLQKQQNQSQNEQVQKIQKKEKPAKKSVSKTPAKQVDKYREAIENYLNIENKDVSTYIAIANTYKLMQEPQNALKYYFEALQLSPQNSDIFYSIGLTYLELNEIETAKKYLENSIALNKENTKAINLLSFVNQKIVTQTINSAYSDFENKQYINAFETLNSGIKEYPNNAQLYYYRALVCDAIGRNAAQIIDLQKAIELDPAYYMSYYQLGLAYEKVKDERSALVAYERFLSVEPDEKELIKEVQKKVLTLGAKYY